MAGMAMDKQKEELKIALILLSSLWIATWVWMLVVVCVLYTNKDPVAGALRLILGIAMVPTIFIGSVATFVLWRLFKWLRAM